MNDQVTSSMVAAAATALITVFAAWLQEVVRNRSRKNARQRSLTYFKDEIAAIETWTNARIALASDGESNNLRRRACHDLDAAYEKLQELLAEGEERPVALQGAISRLLLRHIPLQGWPRLVRFAYYASLGMAFVWAGTWIAAQKSWTDPGEVMASVVAYLILAVLPAWLLAWWTIRLGRQMLDR